MSFHIFLLENLREPSMEPRTVATFTLAVRRSNHFAKSTFNHFFRQLFNAALKFFGQISARFSASRFWRHYCTYMIPPVTVRTQQHFPALFLGVGGGGGVG